VKTGALRFWHRREVEPGTTWTLDASLVEVRADGGSFTRVRQLFESSANWLHTDDFLSPEPVERVDLSSYAGQDVEIRFWFEPRSIWRRAAT
jgi:hypothetical protein